MKRKITFILTSLFFINFIYSQELRVGLDLRDRFEYRHGFSTLFPDDGDPAAFVRQRTRLNINYLADWIEVQLSLQDVSTWGDTRQILPSDGNDSFSLFQAWAGLSLTENWGLKIGRQSIAYDNERIFGGLDWAMQGRFHDAAIIKYENKGFNADLGFAFNQVGEPLLGSDYNITGFFSYKTMQYLYLSKKWEKSVVSFLFLNNGFQAYTGVNNDITDGTYNRQTTGVYLNIPLSALSLEGFAYYQFGDASQVTKLSAFDLGLEAGFKVGKTQLGLGMEFLSGTDQAGENKNRSFFPLYGTNHKFNGFMDYFYVGNHANNVGLNDVFAKLVLKPGENNSLLIKAHYFSANAKFNDDADKYLGTEIDLVYTQPLLKDVKLNVGYSQMFASEGMSLIKAATPHNNSNNWGWVQIIINPDLFTHSF